jgi:hypothetical protein
LQPLFGLGDRRLHKVIHRTLLHHLF